MSGATLAGAVQERGGRRTALRRVASIAAQYAAVFTLLFVARFVLLGVFVVWMDQECHLGGIAVDVLAHGIRFPLATYAPNEYDNGTFLQALLVALGFATLGRHVLVLRLVTHAIVSAGALAALFLLRRSLRDLGLAGRRARWVGTTVLLVALALAPPLVTMVSTYGVGNHPEGAAIDAILLAIFAAGVLRRTRAGTVLAWMLVGLALYANKGTLLVVPVLAAAEIAAGDGRIRRLAAALVGLVLGALPELLVVATRAGRGWGAIAGKADRGAAGFPANLLRSLDVAADHRPELLAAWALALAFGTVLAWRSRSRTLALVAGFACLHLAALAVMARDFMDFYVLYGYPTICVLLATTVVVAVERAVAAAPRFAAVAVTSALGLVVVLHRPAAGSAGFDTVRRLWNDRAAAACSWRFAEGFGREHDAGAAAPGTTREEWVLARCRSLSEHAQVLDCVGGMARELAWRRGGHARDTSPGLSADERRAWAYHYGTHRYGDDRACADLADGALGAECRAAVRSECLAFADALTRLRTGRPLGRPSCEIPEPPNDAFWAAVRRDLLARAPAPGPDVPETASRDTLEACRPTYARCFPDAR
jgi:hypothetical protein